MTAATSSGERSALDVAGARRPLPMHASASDACPLCGAPLDPEQDWCLNCGAAARTRLAATPNWRVPAATIAVIAVLALGVLAAALVKLAGGSGSSTTPPVTTTVTTPAAAPTTTTPGAASTAPGATPTGPAAATTTPGAATPGPAGSTSVTTTPGGTSATTITPAQRRVLRQDTSPLSGK
ncbi:MAG TPA: hypothetical protein VGH09_09800 [Solirubrobacteraceae bacterium]